MQQKRRERAAAEQDNDRNEEDNKRRKAEDELSQISQALLDITKEKEKEQRERENYENRTCKLIEALKTELEATKQELKSIKEKSQKLEQNQKVEATGLQKREEQTKQQEQENKKVDQQLKARSKDLEKKEEDLHNREQKLKSKEDELKNRETDLNKMAEELKRKIDKQITDENQLKATREEERKRDEERKTKIQKEREEYIKTVNSEKEILRNEYEKALSEKDRKWEEKLQQINQEREREVKEREEKEKEKEKKVGEAEEKQENKEKNQEQKTVDQDKLLDDIKSLQEILAIGKANGEEKKTTEGERNIRPVVEYRKERGSGVRENNQLQRMLRSLNSVGEDVLPDQHQQEGDENEVAHEHKEKQVVKDPVKQKKKIDKQVIKEYFTIADLNKSGQQRSKPKSKLYMEDEWLNELIVEGDNKYFVSCIFDGHGGGEASIIAKEGYSQIFRNAFKKVDQTSDDHVAHLLKLSFEELDQKLLSLGMEYVGCTATVAVIWSSAKGRFLQVANVGDSFAYYWQESGDIISLTECHRVTEPSEKQRIRDSGISINDGQTRIFGLSLARSLGDWFLKQNKTGVVGDPYLSTCQSIIFDPNMMDGWLVLASDGLWDVLEPANVQKMIEDNKSLSLKEICSRVIKSALSVKGCTDNVTLTIIQI